MKEVIIFKKQRDLGTILGDTFKFIRLQWKPLFGLILRIAGPALALLVLAYVYYMQTAFGSLGAIQSNPIFLQNDFGISIILAMLVIMLSGIVYYALMYGTVMYAIQSYIANDGVIVKTEVTTNIRQNFWGLVGTSTLIVLIVIAGTVFCFFPGVYFGVVLASTFAIFVFEKRDATDSISYSFNLIKGEWWITFATLLVVFLLYYFIMLIFQIPQSIYFFAKAFTVAETASADPSSLFDWTYIALNAISLLAQYLLYAIIVITTGFIYFNLNEKKNFTGTMETIESLGERTE